MIYHNEIDKNCCVLLKKHFPESVVDSRSIKDVQAEELKGYKEIHLFAGIGGFSLAFQRSGIRTEGTVLTAGFPCQDLSVAGKRKGLAGERSGLYFELHRIITGIYPDTVVLENVPGLLNSHEGRDFAVVIGGLTGIIPGIPETGWGNAGFFRGPVYSVAYRVLDAQFFGVAQRRRRVFIVGSLGDGRAAEVLFEPESGERDTPPRREAGEGTARDIVGSLDSGGSGGRNAHGGTWSGTTVQSASAGHAFPVTFNTFGGNKRKDRPEGGFYVEEDAQVAKTLNNSGPEAAQGGTLVAFQQNTRDEVRLMNGDGKIAGAISAEPGAKQQNYIAFSSKDGGQDAGEIAPTLRSMEYDKSHANGGGQIAVAYSIASNAIGRKPENGPQRGDWAENVSHTLDTMSQPHAVAYALNSKNNRYDAESQTLLPVAYSPFHDEHKGRGANFKESDVNHGLRQPNGTDNTLVAHVGVRRLTPTECERLQGFPDGWTAGFADSTRYRMLGNAVAVPVVEWIGKRIASPTTT